MHDSFHFPLSSGGSSPRLASCIPRACFETPRLFPCGTSPSRCRKDARSARIGNDRGELHSSGPAARRRVIGWIRLARHLRPFRSRVSANDSRHGLSRVMPSASHRLSGFCWRQSTRWRKRRFGRAEQGRNLGFGPLNRRPPFGRPRFEGPCRARWSVSARITGLKWSGPPALADRALGQSARASSFPRCARAPRPLLRYALGSLNHSASNWELSRPLASFGSPRVPKCT